MGYGYESDGRDDEGISGKKLALFFILALGGAIFFIQALFGFPLFDLVREEVTEEVEVKIKQEGTCVVETADHPRTIPDCPYNVGDTLIVKYKEGTQPIEEHRLK